MDAVRDEIINLVKKELNSANKKFPLFHSDHEGYAIIKEEYDECFDELVNARGHIGQIWVDIKANNNGIRGIELLQIDAVNIAVEAIQMAAMTQKYIQSQKRRKIDELLPGILSMEAQRIEG